MDLPEHQLKTNTLQRRLGDYLIADGQITAEQLNDAIEYQSIYGGRLGTSLIELSLISEEQLAQMLSKQQRLHYIKPDLLMNVPAKVLALVPQKVALKYKVVPYQEEKGKLFLAMSDASNLAQIDELSFQLNHIIVPLAIPEVRLMLALKRHYKMGLSPRFASLEAQIKVRSKAVGKIRKKPTVDPELKSEDIWPLLGEVEYEGEEPSDDAYFDIGTAPLEMSQTSLNQQLVAATDRNDIARALINYLAQDFLASALLMVRPTTVTGWLAQCRHVEPSGFEELNMPLHEPSIFNEVIGSKSPYLGSVTKTPQNKKLLGFFDCCPSATALIIPLMVQNRLVCMLYVQDRLEILEQRYAELQKIAHKAEMSFTLLILKNKILKT